MKRFLILTAILTVPLQLIGNNFCCYRYDNEWSFKIAPYIWMAGLKGEVATLPPLPPVHVDISFSKVLHHLDAALMLTAEARKGPMSLAADIMYVNLSGSAHFPDGRFSSAHLKTKYWVGTLALGYDIVRTNCFSWEAVAGARIWSVTTDLTLATGLLPGLFFERKQTWVDPFVGLRAYKKLNCGFSIQGRGLIGGFDISSKLFWDVYGALGYIWDYNCIAFELLGGYRWLSVDYKRGDYLFDVDQFGPLLGLVISF